MVLRHPGILCGAIISILLGWVVQTAELVSWIGVPGNLFIRAIKCLVTPLMFCSLLVGMTDMLAVGKAGSTIGWRTGVLYFTTTVVATIEGLLWVLLFSPYFSNRETGGTAAKVATMAFRCDAPGSS